MYLRDPTNGLMVLPGFDFAVLKLGIFDSYIAHFCDQYRLCIFRLVFSTCDVFVINQSCMICVQEYEDLFIRWK